MTAAIGHKFFNAAATRPATGSAAGRHGEDVGDAAAFGDLVHKPGKRNMHAEARHSGETKAAQDAAATRDGRPAAAVDAMIAEHPEATSPLDDGQAAKGARHFHGAAHDRSADDDGKDEKQPETTKPDEAPPLRDRLPLLVTLHELGQRGANRPSMGDGTSRIRSHIEKAAPSSDHGTGKPATLAATAVISTADTKFATQAAGPAKDGADAAGSRLASTPTVQAEASKVESVVATTVSPERLAHSDTLPAGRAAVSPPSGEGGGSSGRSTASSQKGAAAPVNPENDPSQLSVETDSGAEPARAVRRFIDRRDSGSDPDGGARSGADRQATGSVTVAADRSFPAPAAHPVSTTTASVIDALAATRNQALANPVSPPVQPPTVALPAHLLRIELHPADLGAVVANLRISDGQLSVELKPETAEAYRRLSGDSETIAKSLKKLGLDVDTVTVMQPAIAASPVARADTGSQASSMPGRDAPQFQSGTSGGNGENFGGQQSGRNRGHDGQAFDRPAPAHRERAGGSLFI
jgi:chemotaxis protein MotD